jgi:hypothetical protein
VKICDSSYLIAFLHPNPNPPMDRLRKPVTQFRERISALIEELSATNDIIGIPTPALAETLVRSGPNRAQYMKILGDSWKFQLIPFDSRAAIEAAELVAAVKTSKEKWDTWAKVKFDIQIVAMAKAEGVSVIYSDDQDLDNYAKRFNIRVIRICDLPLPPSQEDKPIEVGPIGSQIALALADDPAPVTQVEAEPAALETKSDETTEPKPPIPTGDGAAEAVQPSNELKADPPHPVAVQGSDRRRAQNEVAAEEEIKPCECGCGEFPKLATSRFLPGHDLRKAYKDSQS